MKQLLVAGLILALVLNLCASKQVGFSCLLFLNYTYFDLSSLYSNNQDHIAVTSDTKEQIYWNLCKYMISDRTQNVFAELIQQQTDNITLTGSSADSIKLIDAKSPDKGVVIDFSKSKTDEKLRLVLNCGKGFNYKDVQRKDKFTQIILESSEACPKIELGQLMKIVEKYQDYIAIACIFLGIILCFGGFYFFKLALFLCTFFAVFIIGMMIGTSAANQSIQNNTTDWIIISCALTVAISAGLLVAKFEKYGFFFLGAFSGMLLAFLLYSCIIQHITSDKVVFYVFISIMGVAFGVLTLWIKKGLQILITSFIGSYLLVRSFSAFMGENAKFPNELLLIYQIKSFDYKFPTSFYIYFSVILVLWIIGIYTQAKLQAKTKKKEKRKRDDERVSLLDEEDK